MNLKVQTFVDNMASLVWYTVMLELLIWVWGGNLGLGLAIGALACYPIDRFFMWYNRRRDQVPDWWRELPGEHDL